MKKIVKKFLDISIRINHLSMVKDTVIKTCTQLGRMECALLTFLDKVDEPVCMNDLSKELNVSHSRITRLVDSLVNKDLVDRYPSKKDRRRWYAEITQKGRNLANNSSEEAVKLQEDVLAKLPKEEIEGIYETIEKYLNAYQSALEEMETIETNAPVDEVD